MVSVTGKKIVRIDISQVSSFMALKVSLIRFRKPISKPDKTGNGLTKDCVTFEDNYEILANLNNLSKTCIEPIIFPHILKIDPIKHVVWSVMAMSAGRLH